MVNRRPIGDFASSNLIDSWAVFSLNFSAFSVYTISNPPKPPTELIDLWVIPAFREYTMFSNRKYESFCLIILPNELRKR